MIQPRCWKTLSTKLACKLACAGDDARINQSLKYIYNLIHADAVAVAEAVGWIPVEMLPTQMGGT